MILMKSKKKKVKTKFSLFKKYIYYKDKFN